VKSANIYKIIIYNYRGTILLICNEQLFQSQREISSFLDKIHLGLSKWLASSKTVAGEKRNLVENSLLYTLQVKQDELKLQAKITDQGIKNLELIQNNNKALLTRISDLLTNSLGSLMTSSKVLFLMNKLQV
jgi:DNA-binding PadR family transcriptional regulator